jgi:simple sugar transport system ATP-binding protein
MSQRPATQSATATAAASSGAAVELRGITKRFPGVVANDAVSLAAYAGEIHCLLGENGAGKSTLMSILAGLLTPDAGQIRRGGRVVHIPSPRHARALGIGLVPQHPVLVPGLTVLENLMLGESRGLRLERAQARGRRRELAGVLGVTLAPDALCGTLALGQQQQVAIIKALWPGTQVLILDEPTSLLTPRGVADLQRVLVRLKGQGVAVILITHKLHEALAVADRITVLRRGRVVGMLDAPALRTQAPEVVQKMIVAMMFGDEARLAMHQAELPRESSVRWPHQDLPGQPLLELVGVSAQAEQGAIGIQDIALALHAGEVLGIAGVDGNGQRALAEAIAGQVPLTAGELRFAGRSIAHLSVAARQRLGLRYVTDDRLGEGIVPSLSVALNLFLKRIGQAPYWRRGRMQHRAITQAAQALVARFDVRTPSVATRIGTLSGGNMQKVLLARDLSFEPRVVVYHKPTQGLDVRTTAWVRERIRAQATAGVAALVISPDLEDLLALCDRVAVLSRGCVVGVVENGADAAARIGALMVAEPAPARRKREA